MTRTNMPGRWKEMKLIEVSQSISAGGTPRRDKKEFWNNGTIPWLKISDMKDTYISKTNEKITENGLKNSSAKLFPKGTLVYSIFATLGAIGILEINATTNQAIVGITPKKEIIDTKYLYYCLQSERNKILEKKSHATQDNLNLGILKNHIISVPPLPIQDKIVLILEKAEKLKEFRKEADELTNEFLRSVFLEMFGDERKNTKKFEIKGFLDVFDTTTGKLDSNASVEDGKYPFFTCSQETFKIDKYSFDCEALLLAGNNAAAKYSIKHYKGKFDVYQRTYILTLKNNSELYSFYHYQLEQKLGELQNKSIGTNTKYLTLGILRDIKIICPSLPLQNKFASIVKEVESMKEQQKYSKEKLDNLFNVLMQKAFNGELIK